MVQAARMQVVRFLSSTHLKSTSEHLKNQQKLKHAKIHLNTRKKTFKTRRKNRFHFENFFYW